ncbi:energy-coupling factor ABC transporter ATP-binding protein [Ligilactobacillus cholophilus]|uniref:energy-coupling factor ABC transporter ATP-binding protein n=1 Tax=Ligilactobacillus cholophilus TaxID=3050131 RepID=UPI0025AFCB15|nr:ABC transporter ATP-binding protein [Ligilactobacillus cholophilus]
MFEIKDLGFNYGKKVVFHDISFTINEGDFLCLMGPNGSGKTTFLQMLEGFLVPQHGEISYKGMNLRKWLDKPITKKKYHQQVGILFQNVDIQLFNSTVYDEIAFGPKQMNLSQEEVDERVNDCLRLFNLEHLKDNVPYHLSGGEKRMVALASVLALNPQVILLDEPLIGLTNDNRQKMLHIFKQLNQIGKTIILITHYYQQIKELASDYLIFKDGTAQHKTQDELQESPDLIEQVEKY